MARTAMVMPDGLVKAVNRLVGRRRRSQLVTEAVRARLERERLLIPLEAVAGSLADVPIPGWETSESETEWVRSPRQKSAVAPRECS